MALERFVFRPLAVLGGDPAQTLVASIGVFVLLALLRGTGASLGLTTVIFTLLALGWLIYGDRIPPLSMLGAALALTGVSWGAWHISRDVLPEDA